MLVVGTNHTLDLCQVGHQELLPLIPIRVGPDGTRQRASCARTGAMRAGSARKRDSANRCVASRNLSICCWRFMVRLFSVAVQAASFDRSATRFMSVCKFLSSHKRLLRSTKSSALTITASKKPSTTERSAASSLSARS